MDERAAFFCWDAGGVPPLDCMGRLDAVVHLAGEPVAQRWNTEVRQRIRDSRLDGTRRLVDAISALRLKPSVLVSASAMGYYGDGGESILTESSPAGGGFLADTCVRWEQEATRANDFGVRAVPIRIALVLGAGGGMMKRVLPLFRAGLGGKLGDGHQWISWIHVDDLVRMIIFAAENRGVTTVLNGSSPNPVRNEEFTRELAAALKRPAVLPVPKFALRLAMGPVADHILDSARVVPDAAIAHGFQFDYSRLGSCFSELLGKSGKHGQGRIVA